MSLTTKILLLKQTASMRHWFVELGTDLAEAVGPVVMYTSVESDHRIGNLHIMAAPPYRRDSDLYRLWTWFRYFVGAIWLVFRHSPRPLLFIVAQPPYLPVIGCARKFLFGQHYAVWVDDIFPDALVRHRRLSERSLITRVWRQFNRLVLRHADCVFTLGDCMANVLRQYLPAGHRISVVPTWVDTTVIRPVPKEKNPFAIQHGQTGKLTVLYSGNLGLSHDLDTIVKAAERLRNRPDLHFMIIGDGLKWTDLERAAARLGNLTLLPLQSEHMLPYSLATGDIAVVSLDRGFEGISMPSKTYYMMAAGCALIGLSNRPSDLQIVIEHHRCGVNLEPGDVNGFVGAVTRFLEDRPYLELCRRNARLAAEKRFSRKVNVGCVWKAIQPFLE